MFQRLQERKPWVSLHFNACKGLFKVIRGSKGWEMLKLISGGKPKSCFIYPSATLSKPAPVHRYPGMFAASERLQWRIRRTNQWTILPREAMRRNGLWMLWIMDNVSTLCLPVCQVESQVSSQVWPTWGKDERSKRHKKNYHLSRQRCGHELDRLLKCKGQLLLSLPMLRFHWPRDYRITENQQEVFFHIFASCCSQ